MSKRLIELTTDLKSLNYTPEASPYVVKDINNPPSTNFLVQEGTSRIDDLTRISKMIVNTPGVNYLLHEAQLQQIGISQRIKSSKAKGKTTAGAIVKEVGRTVKNTAQIVASTLAQVAVNGTGTHFLKGFRTDTYLQPAVSQQASGFAEFFGEGGIEGASYVLSGEKVPSNISSKLEESETESSLSYTGEGDLSKPALQTPIQGNKEVGDAGRAIQEVKQGQVVVVSNMYTSSLVKEEKVLRQSNLNYTGTGDPSKTRVTPNKIIPNTVPPSELVKQGKQVAPSTLYTSSFVEGVSIRRDSILDTDNTTSNPEYLEQIKAGKKVILKTNRVNGVGSYSPSHYKTDVTDPRIGVGLTVGDVTAVDGSVDVAGTVGEVSIKPPINLPELPQKLTSGSVSYSDNWTVKEPTIGEDFREETSQDYTRYTFTGAGSKTKEVTYGLGNQAGRKARKISYSTDVTGDSTFADKINMQGVLSSTPSTPLNDFIELSFKEILTGKFVQFRAFLDSMDDNYNADWQGNRYVGRADEFYTYGGFSRDVNISFKIAASSRAEVKPLYEKMNFLASTTAPTYVDKIGIMQGTVVELTVGSYFKKLPGVITSVKYSLEQDSPWDVGEAVKGTLTEVPTVLNCSVSFKAIHNFTPQVGKLNYFGIVT